MKNSLNERTPTQSNNHTNQQLSTLLLNKTSKRDQQSCIGSKPFGHLGQKLRDTFRVSKV